MKKSKDLSEEIGRVQDRIQESEKALAESRPETASKNSGLEQTIRQCKELLRTIMDASTDLVWSALPDGTADYVKRDHFVEFIAG